MLIDHPDHIRSLAGLTVVPSDELVDGDVWIYGGQHLIVGVRPRTRLERARYDARAIVQNGLSDVLAWLGEKPIPRIPIRGADILDALVTTAVLQGGPKDGAEVTFSGGFAGLGFMRELQAYAPDATYPTEPLFDTVTYRQQFTRTWLGAYFPAVDRQGRYVFTYSGA